MTNSGKPLPWDELFAAAERARVRAYAPYSQFLVGAALLFDDGRIYSGCNVENSSYGLSQCAERTAVGKAISEGGRKLLAAAIVVDSKVPTPPCGMCRQVLAEFGGPEVPVKSRNPGGDELSTTIGELLPHAFSRDFL